MTSSEGQATPGQAAPNPWRWHDAADPYRDTAFGAMGVGPSTVLKRAHVRRRQQQVDYGTVRHLGRRIDAARVHAADRQLTDPRTRILETLRTHHPHPATVEVADLAARVASPEDPMDSGPVELDRALLTRLLPALPRRTFPPVALPVRDA